MSVMTSEARPLSIYEVHEGDTYTETIAITPERMEAFIAVSADRALAHVDAEHARSMGYERELVHGFLVALPYSRLLGMFLPGSNTVIHQIQFEALAPTYVGDTLTYEVRVARVVPAVKTVLLELSVRNAAGTIVNRGRSTCVFRR